MARSLKKGPFADKSLLKKVDAQVASGDTQVISSFHYFPINRRIDICST